MWFKTIHDKKEGVYHLMRKHVYHHNTMCRYLFTKYLKGEKWKNTATINKAWIYLLDWIRKKSLQKWEKTDCITPNMNFFFKKKKENSTFRGVHSLPFGISRNSKWFMTVFQFLNIFILLSGTYKNKLPMYPHFMVLRFLNASLINNCKTYDL